MAQNFVVYHREQAFLLTLPARGQQPRVTPWDAGPGSGPETTPSDGRGVPPPVCASVPVRVEHVPGGAVSAVAEV